MTLDPWGIVDRYQDALRTWRTISPQARSAILAAMGVDADSPPPRADAVRLVPAGEETTLEHVGELTLEDGTVLAVRDRLPDDLPIGYHNLVTDRGATRLIVSPGKCFLPTDKHWCWAVQLYGARSRSSWGIGDLGDLARIARWSASLGAGFVLINPLHAVAPVVPQEASPYYPSSRRFTNPLYLRIENIPGYAEHEARLAPLAAAGRALSDDRLIARDDVFRLKMQALEVLYEAFGSSQHFELFCTERGRSLVEFATYCALAETFGKNWRMWDAAYRRPDGPAVARFAQETSRRIRFHQWLQWLTDQQLEAASAELPMMQDLAIGADPDGADAWHWQNLLANGVSIGAPPDLFNTLGQDWGLPPMVPHRLREAGYEPLIEVIRASLRHAGGLRIDHALGLFRLFWIPHGMSAAAGAYVCYRADEQLAIVAIESQRAGSLVVGEDLGTVEPGFRQTLEDHRVLSYRVFWFEDVPPKDYPELALAAVTTHDLPTIAGLWTGSDLAEQIELELEPNEEGAAEMRARLQSVAGVRESDEPETVIAKTYEALAEAPCVLLSAMLEDVLAVEERANIPSTNHERPNWSLALPRPLEELEMSPLARTVASALGNRENILPHVPLGTPEKLEPR